MLKRIETWIIKGEQIVVIGTALLALALLIADRFPSLSGMFQEDLPSLTLFLLSIFVLSFFARERMLGEIAKWRALGLQAVYHGRNDPDQFPAYMDLLNHAKRDLFIVGITLKDLRSQMPLLVEKGRQACSIEFLMMDPHYWKNRDPILDPVAAALGENLKADFQLAVAQTRVLAINLANKQGRLDVRFYQQSPTLSLIAVDARSAQARMRIELTPHNSPRHGFFRPLLDIQRAGERDLFGQFHQHYRALWDDSLPYLSVHDSKVWVNLELDQEISGQLDLPADWLPAGLRPAEATAEESGQGLA